MSCRVREIRVFVSFFSIRGLAETYSNKQTTRIVSKKSADISTHWWLLPPISQQSNSDRLCIKVTLCLWIRARPCFAQKWFYASTLSRSQWNSLLDNFRGAQICVGSGSCGARLRISSQLDDSIEREVFISVWHLNLNGVGCVPVVLVMCPVSNLPLSFQSTKGKSNRPIPLVEILEAIIIPIF